MKKFSKYFKLDRKTILSVIVAVIIIAILIAESIHAAGRVSFLTYFILLAITNLILILFFKIKILKPSNKKVILSFIFVILIGTILLLAFIYQWKILPTLLSPILFWSILIALLTASVYIDWWIWFKD